MCDYSRRVMPWSRPGDSLWLGLCRGLAMVAQGEDIAVADAPIDRTRLPMADPAFMGTVNRTLAGSAPDWGLIGHVTPPEGAPNVLLVLVDDAGFGQPSTFGGPIAAPAMTRVAEEGARYNRFHVTGLCSPTRAALLVGREPSRRGIWLDRRVARRLSRFTGGRTGHGGPLNRAGAAAQRILGPAGSANGTFAPDDEQTGPDST